MCQDARGYHTYTILITITLPKVFPLPDSFNPTFRHSTCLTISFISPAGRQTPDSPPAAATPSVQLSDLRLVPLPDCATATTTRYLGMISYNVDVVVVLTSKGVRLN